MKKKKKTDTVFSLHGMLVMYLTGGISRAKIYD